MSEGRTRLAALTTLVGICLAGSAVFFWPVPLHLGTSHPISEFGDGHVWVFARIARMLVGAEEWTTATSDAGFPTTLDARFLGWAPALLAAPLQPLLGAVGACNAVMLATPALSALAAFWMLRRVTEAGPWIAAVAAATYGLSPYALASLSNGQLEKAQLWVYPLVIGLVVASTQGPKSGRALLLTPVAVLAAVFTCPYFGLVLPLVLVPVGLGVGLREAVRARSLRPVLAAGLALALVAGATAPAALYFRPNEPAPDRPEVPSMFRPADRPHPSDGRDHPFLQSPSAQPRDTLLGPGPGAIRTDQANHVTYLGAPLLVLAALALPFGRRGRWLGAGVFVVGIGIAAGPVLVSDGMYQVRDGLPYELPAIWLERWRYPLAHGGQYYRAIPIASLGLAVLAAAGLARAAQALRSALGGPLGATRAGIAGAVGLVAVGGLLLGDLARPWAAVTPWPQEKLPGLEALPRLSEGPPGAVLALPFLGAQTTGSYGLLSATLHGRPTSAVARGVREVEAVRFAPWIEGVRVAAAEGRLKAALIGLGFGYVVLTEEFSRAQDPDLPGFDRASLSAALGEPEAGDGVLIWRLGE